MRTWIDYSVVMSIPHAQAWEKLRDLTQPHAYVPGLLGCDMHTDQREGVGVSRRVYKRFMALDETVVSWQDGEGFTLRLHDGEKDKPLPGAHFSYKIAPEGEAQTRLTVAMYYMFPLGLVGQWLDKLLVRGQVNKEIRDVGLAVKHYYETSQSPSKQDLKRLRATHP